MTHLLLYTVNESYIESQPIASYEGCEVIYDLDDATNFLPDEVTILAVMTEKTSEQDKIRSLLTQQYTIILLAQLPSTEEALAWFALGIKGYMNLYASEERIRQVIDVVNSGNVWLGQNVMQALIHQVQPSESTSVSWKARVTEREEETLKLVMQGLSNMEIAETMHISERTVKAHISHLLEKFAVKDRLALVLCIQNWQD